MHFLAYLDLLVYRLLFVLQVSDQQHIQSYISMHACMHSYIQIYTYSEFPACIANFMYAPAKGKVPLETTGKFCHTTVSEIYLHLSHKWIASG
jgi:hypothetical protein